MRGNVTTRLLGLIALALGVLKGESPPPSEYQVNAAFLYNFVKFVEWPSTPGEPSAPIELCILGQDPFDGELQRVVNGKSVNGRPLAVRRISDKSAAPSCRILFVSASEAGHVAEIINAVKDSSVLTVSEISRFADRGGMINFLMDGQRVRFQINPVAAAR